jgi:hypothetical protein
MPVVKNGKSGQLVEFPSLSKKEKKELTGPAIGTAFDAYTRLFAYFSDGDVFEVGEWRSRDMDLMLTRDGKAAMVEQALTLPISSNEYVLEKAQGDSGELEMCHQQIMSPPEAGGFKPGFTTLIRQIAEAAVYRKEFFEKEWEFDGETTWLRQVQWRPPETCAIRRDEHTAEFDGFRQRAWWYFTSPSAGKKKGLEKAYGKNFTGYLDIPKVRSYVHIHGTARNPLLGTSDMEIAYWAYKQKQKVLFLWLQFLETQSLPKLAVYGADPDQAEADAETISQMKASSTAGFIRPPAGARLFDVIESSGAGAAQFASAIDYLGSYQTDSAMASFLSLGTAASLGRGSYALSESASQFFLQARQNAVKEIEDSFTASILVPLCVYNFGSEAKVPRLKGAPLDKSSTAQIISTLTAFAAAPSPHTIPDEYTYLLAEKAATIFDLPMERVEKALKDGIEQLQKQAAAASAAGASPMGQGAAKIAGATNAAQKIVQQQTRGGAKDALSGGGYGANSVASS